MRFTTITFITTAILLSACASGPVIVHGEAELGDRPANASINLDSITAANANIHISQGSVICTAEFSNYSLETEINLPITCNDGRSGTALIVRSNSFSASYITFTLNDGTVGRAAIGNTSLDQN